eukprot:Phypoly_transcript_17763.p1 GENE.Phypoly_transcript_17763~~Phypoly_transcript_17763.p1  ORF type:complete len:187 (+),score=38.14 Phypoly_transcript_17763:99-659(+)
MAYKQRWLEYFEALDADGSGAIDPGDLSYATKTFSKMLGKPEDSAEVKSHAAAYSTFFHDLVKAFDINKDGSISKDELLAGVEKYFIGKTPETVPDWWKAHVLQAFEAVDINGDGDLSVEEKVSFVKRLVPSASEADITAAYAWGIKQGSSGKYDATTLSRIVFKWATDPNPTPEASLLLPFFSKH